MLSKELLNIFEGSNFFELTNIEEEKEISAKIYAVFNRAHPFDDLFSTAAFYAISNAEKDGRLLPHGTLITSCADENDVDVAKITAQRNYYCIAVLPEDHPEEQRNILEALGVQIYLTPTELGSAGVEVKSKNLAKDIPGSFIISHKDILFQDKPESIDTDMIMQGFREIPDVDVFLAKDTGAKNLFVAKEFLKSNSSNTKIYDVNPQEAGLSSNTDALISDEKIDKTMPDIKDGEILYNMENAFFAAKLLAKKEGILLGIDACAPLHATLSLAKKEEYSGKTFLIYLCDDGKRFYESPLFITGR